MRGHESGRRYGMRGHESGRRYGMRVTWEWTQVWYEGDIRVDAGMV